MSKEVQPEYLLQWSRDLDASDKLPEPLTNQKAIPLTEAIWLLLEQGLIRTQDVYNEQVQLITLCKGLGWGELGRRLSLLTGGQVWPGSQSISHNPGGRRPVTYLLPKVKLDSGVDAIEEVYNARKIVEQVTGEVPTTWSMSGCARALLEYVALRQEFARPMEALLKTVDPAKTSFHFYHCEPGPVKDAALWDIRSAYWQLLCRLPSPYIYLKDNGKVGFMSIEKPALERWQTVLAAVGGHKRLRNILTGCMSKDGGSSFFSRGKCYEPKPKDGCLRPAALLVIRAAYELTALAQQQESARYSNTDCVVTTSKSAPDAWQKYCIESKLQSTGDAEIYSLGNYRVGNKATKWYWKGSRFHGPMVGVKIAGASVLDFLDCNMAPVPGELVAGKVWK